MSMLVLKGRNACSQVCLQGRQAPCDGKRGGPRRRQRRQKPLTVGQTVINVAAHITVVRPVVIAPCDLHAEVVLATTIYDTPQNKTTVEFMAPALCGTCEYAVSGSSYISGFDGTPVLHVATARAVRVKCDAAYVVCRGTRAVAHHDSDAVYNVSLGDMDLLAMWMLFSSSGKAKGKKQ